MNQPEINMSQHKKCAEISAHRRNRAELFSWAAKFYCQQQISLKTTTTKNSKKTHTQNCSYDKYIIGNWKIEKAKKAKKNMKLLSLLFVLKWFMFSVVHCVSCRLLGVWVVGWLRFSWNSICGWNFTFLFPWTNIFFQNEMCASLALCIGKLKNIENWMSHPLWDVK